MVEYEVKETVVIKKRDQVRRCDRCGVEISRIVDVDNANDMVKNSVKSTDDAHKLSFSKIGNTSMETESMDLCDQCKAYVFDLLAAEKKSWSKNENPGDKKDERK